jgi:uncharacterized cupin superfamily protein
MSAKILWTSAEIKKLPETKRVHPLNANAVRHQRTLSEAAGMENLGVHMVRVEPGCETTEFHAHHCEEEFLYILSGEGVARIGNQETRVAAGDFMGFATGGLPHSMRNEGADDLVYLMVGERRIVEMVDFPRIRKRLVRVRDERDYIDRPTER